MEPTADYDALRSLAEDCVSRNDGPLPPALAQAVLDLLARVIPPERGYAEGLADAGAALVAVVAGELGPDHPLVDRMVQRLGRLAP